MYASKAPKSESAVTCHLSGGAGYGPEPSAGTWRWNYRTSVNLIQAMVELLDDAVRCVHRAVAADNLGAENTPSTKQAVQFKSLPRRLLSLAPQTSLQTLILHTPK